MAERPGRHRDCRLPLSRDVVAIRAIHPGEQLTEELKELRMSAAERARLPDQPCDRNLKRQTRNHRRYRPSTRSFLRDNGGVLAQLAEPMLVARCAEESGKIDGPTADSEGCRGSACIASSFWGYFLPLRRKGGGHLRLTRWRWLLPSRFGCL